MLASSAITNVHRLSTHMNNSYPLYGRKPHVFHSHGTDISNYTFTHYDHSYKQPGTAYHVQAQYKICSQVVRVVL